MFPPTSPSFDDLGLPDAIVDVLASNGIFEPFPIQAEAIPAVLAGRDVAGKAPTGSGKTLAFGLPILATVPVAQPNRPTALILSPTRELAAQIRKDLAPYAKAMRRQAFAVYGGVRYQAQFDWLGRGIDVLVATPGRLEDLIDQGAVDLADVSIVAVDEADRMADMGFLPSVRALIDQTSPGRQTLLFSATLDGDVKVLVKRYQDDPVRVEAGSIESDALSAEHVFWSVDHKEKVERTAEIIDATGNCIVFARTRHGADRLARDLRRRDVRATAIHGGLTQGQRNRALNQFKAGDVEALIATDVAARGIHVDGVAAVVHYDPPNGHKDYLHRSGRTARAGSSGIVVSLVLQKERRAARRMQHNIGLDIPIEEPRIHRLYGMPSTGTRHRTPETGGTAGTRKRNERGAAAPEPTPTPKARSARSGNKRGKQQRPDSAGSISGELVVSNLPWKATDADLRRLFAKHGKVRAAKVKLDKRGRSKGVGIVELHPTAARKAARALDGRRVGGREIKVRVGMRPKA